MASAYQENIHAVLQENGPDHADIQGAVLTGWIVVTEWMSVDGEKWLSRCNSPMTPIWTCRGMLHEVLEAQWPRDEEED